MESAHRELNPHPARLSVYILNAVIERFLGTVITEVVKIWSENALGARSQESCELHFRTLRYRDERKPSRQLRVFDAEILSVFLPVRYNYRLSEKARTEFN